MALQPAQKEKKPANTGPTPWGYNPNQVQKKVVDEEAEAKKREKAE